MGAALSIFVLLSVSIFVVRVAAVALRITGLPENSSRFQALSAFTGTGFTTSEAEMVVNYPIRRRIVSLLMIIGNMGFVTVFATIVVSLVRTDGDVGAVIAQLTWLLGGLSLLWFLMLNDTADRLMCSFIGNVLESATFLGTRSFRRLVQVSNGYSVCEHTLEPIGANEYGAALPTTMAQLNLELLAVRRAGGELCVDIGGDAQIESGDTLVIFGRDSGHEALADDLGRVAKLPEKFNIKQDEKQ
jgi:hypothetical protein